MVLMDYCYLLFYDFQLFDYLDNDWEGNLDDRSSTTGFVFYIDDIVFT